MRKLGIASLILTPLSKLGKPAHPDVTVNINFHPIVCNIKYDCREPRMIRDEWMITTFLFFLGRYLSISDDRQRSVMAEVLSELFETDEEKDMDILSDLTYENVFKTLLGAERNAAVKLFDMFPPTSLYIGSGEDTIPEQTYAKYIYSLVNKNGHIQTHLQLGPADMLLLPLAVVHLYKLTYGSIVSDDNNKIILQNLSKAVLSDYYNNAKGMSWMHSGVENIIRDQSDLLSAL